MGTLGEAGETAAVRDAVEAVPRKAESPLRRLATDFVSNPIAVFGLALFGIILFLALFAPLISPQNPYDLAQLDIMDARLEPGATSADGHRFWLGTDDQGRDMLSAIFYGLRISLAVGASSTILALCIGLTMGRPAPYAAGRAEWIIMRTAAIH